MFSMKNTDLPRIEAVIERITALIEANDFPGFRIEQLNLALPDGSKLVLFWDAEANAWTITTS